MSEHLSEIVNKRDSSMFNSSTLEELKVDVYEEEVEVLPRIDVIADLEAPHARHNLNKLLYRLYNNSPYLRIFVNKWHEWDDFSHKDNPAAPRATYFPGCFMVYCERKLITRYDMYAEKVKAEQKKSRNLKMGSTHSSFVESETRNSVEQ